MFDVHTSIFMCSAMQGLRVRSDSDLDSELESVPVVCYKNTCTRTGHIAHRHTRIHHQQHHHQHRCCCCRQRIIITTIAPTNEPKRFLCSCRARSLARSRECVSSCTQLVCVCVYCHRIRGYFAICRCYIVYRCITNLIIFFEVFSFSLCPSFITCSSSLFFLFQPVFSVCLILCHFLSKLLRI